MEIGEFHGQRVFKGPEETRRELAVDDDIGRGLANQLRQPVFVELACAGEFVLDPSLRIE